jgi:hypothetical protein
MLPADADPAVPSQPEQADKALQCISDLDYVPEVSSLMFRYFDSDTWHDRWDTRSNNTLPNAIELRFQLAQDHTPRPTLAEVAGSDFNNQLATRNLSLMESLRDGSLGQVDDRSRSPQSRA